jgi:hypothetical protein
MKSYAIGAALLGLLLLPAGPARAQDRDVATVVGLFIEQAPGLLAEERMARGARGPRWAEIKRGDPGAKSPTEMIRIPAGVTVRPGDRMLVASRSSTPSASAGAGTPARLLVDPQLERPLDFTAQGLRAPVARPLAVVPGSCIPF